MNEDLISKKELNFILKFIQINENLFEKNTVSPNRKFLSSINSVKLFFDIKKRILIKENILYNYIDDVGDYYRDFIGIITNGGKIHNHIDRSPIPGYDLVRFNLFLSIPKKGGFPIYNGVTIPVSIGDYVRCNSSKEFHECEVVEGNIPRIVISYGILLKNANNLLNYQ